jgi:hypothetical protein
VRPKRKQLRKPRIGEKVYIPPCGDCFGGLAEISSFENGTSGGKKVIFVKFVGVTGNRFSWNNLLRKQKRLRGLYKDKIARPDPDWD